MLQFDLNQCTDIIQRPIRGSRGYHLADRGPYGLGFNAESAVHEIKSRLSRCDVLDLIVLDLFRTR